MSGGGEGGPDKILKPLPITGQRLPKRQIRETVEFSVRGPISINMDDHRKRHPGCSVVDLVFPRPSKVREVVFRNYYTAWMTILVRRPISLEEASSSDMSSEGVGPWKTAIFHRRLMKFPHLEPGSQDFIKLTNNESEVEWDNLLTMRLILRQPSPTWRTFHVEELNVYRDSPRYSQSCITYYNTRGVARYLQQYDTLLPLVIKQTQGAIDKLDPFLDVGFPTPKDNTAPACYEISKLPML